jgi:FtsZ-binding cell division protein ZapB
MFSSNLKEITMETADVVRFGLILAVQAEIEGMKAENMQRQQNNESMAYSDEDFQAQAEQLRNISWCHEQQL